MTRCLMFALLAFACGPSARTGSTTSTLQNIAIKELGDSPIVTSNNSKTFALAYTEQDGFVKYIVIRHSDFKVVLKEKFHGTVLWAGDFQIRESHVPGIVKKDSKSDDNLKVIDLNQFLPLTK